MEKTSRTDAVKQQKKVSLAKPLQSFDQENQKAVDQAWAAEAESRIEAFEAGKISARSFEANP